METADLELRKFVAPEFVFGVGARKLAGRYALNVGARKVLVVSDPGVVAAGWTQDVLNALEDVGLHFSLFTSLTSNPKAEEVQEGARIFRHEGCDSIVAVGGGSPMDCAKGIGIVTATGRHIAEFEGVDRVDMAIPPLICVPTTAGSAADVSQFAIITDRERRKKFAIISKIIVPDAALIDPVTTTSMPPELTFHTGMDSLCHAVESYVSTAHAPITDLHALQAVGTVASNLQAALDFPRNINCRGRMMMASLHAGLAFSNTSLGMTHAMAHAVGGMFDAPHGECNALLLPFVVEFNFSSVPERYRHVGEAMGIRLNGMSHDDVETILVSRLKSVAGTGGGTHRLSELGVSKGDLPRLAEIAMEDPCLFTNPRRPRKEEVEGVYEKAL
ncbi:alcohol dehydrogenase-like regulatory protein ErcA [Geobacter sp. DSM 9736]|uniref:alcohol dehydrogenase-like regulatory protein ErcA n=1 Tax=Geobacter sp. DSM 9736 TaxID=1277350 RepID=UPI000B50191A|nr:alcohol dehydrogenase-like regulatory protein ErcA [Geobacter sp. DSM 9736]SNB46115.1 Alcohol dehydrogenase, class IV [Geobacter sp. DSM 9736]